MTPATRPIEEKDQALHLADQVSRFMIFLSGQLAGEEYLARVLSPWRRQIIFKKDHLEWQEIPGLTVKTIVHTTYQIHQALYQLIRIFLPEVQAKKKIEAGLIEIYKKNSKLPLVYSTLLMMPAGVAENYKLEWASRLMIELDKKERDLQEMRSRIQFQAGDLGITIDELKAAQERLTLLDKARQDFISVVSHQFRTPLSAIRWSAEMLQESLKKNQLNEEEKQALVTIAERGKYLIGTLSKVFDALAIDTGEIKIERQPGFLWETVEEIIIEHEKGLRAKNLAVNFDKSKDPLKELLFDHDKIKTVIRILLDNAINYSDPDGRIKIWTEPKKSNGDEFVMLGVADQGIGIDEREKERIFEKFFRGEEAIKRVPDGTGLGLYIVKHFVQAHGGQVWFDSIKGKGTTFYLTCPIKK